MRTKTVLGSLAKFLLWAAESESLLAKATFFFCLALFMLWYGWWGHWFFWVPVALMLPEPYCYAWWFLFWSYHLGFVPYGLIRLGAYLEEFKTLSQE